MPRRTAAYRPDRPPHVFPIYYLWQTEDNWRAKLGPEGVVGGYPYAEPWPLPATYSDGDTDTDVANTVSSNYPAVTIKAVDVSPNLAYDQANNAILDADMDLAYEMGCRGFAVNWATVAQTAYTNRMNYIINRAETMTNQGQRFRIILDYKGEGRALDGYTRTSESLLQDFNYFLDQHDDKACLWRINGKPVIVFTGSWDYPEDRLIAVQPIRDRALLIGGQPWNRWPTSDPPDTPDPVPAYNIAQYLDGNAPYWSGQDPYQNPSSFNQLKGMSDLIKAEGKFYGAPLTVGYDGRLLYGGTFHVIRKQGETIQRLWDGNMPGNPDFWMQISWNEIHENSHIAPLKRHGTLYTDILSELIAGNPARLY